MNKVEAKRIFSSIIHLLKNQDVTNFEKDYAEDMTCHLNSDNMALDGLRLRVAFFIEHFEVIDLKIEDFVFENKRAAIRFFIKVRNKDDGEELEDHAFYFYHFEDDQVKESWVLTKLPINNKKFSA
jgi:type II secretory pathway component PulL